VVDDEQRPVAERGDEGRQREAADDGLATAARLDPFDTAALVVGDVDNAPRGTARPSAARKRATTVKRPSRPIRTTRLLATA
jgi:hypothetical protein